MTGEPKLPNYNNEPTQTQTALFNHLIGQSLENREFALSWDISYEDDKLYMDIRRDSQCLYSNGTVQKIDTDEEVPITAYDVFSKTSDETYIEINFRHLEPTKIGSKITIKVRGDGYLGAFPGARKGFADGFGVASRTLFNEASGNEPMPSEHVGKAIQKFTEIIGGINLDSATAEQQASIFKAAGYIGLTLSNEFTDPYAPRLSEQVGKTLAGNLVKLVAVKGRLWTSIKKSYRTDNYLVDIEKDPFQSDIFGSNVSGYISVCEYIDEKTLADKGFIYLMNDGRIIFSSAFLPDGPDEDYSKISAQALYYEGVKNAVVREVTADDLTYFLIALQEPEIY
jgi:hypothetical protein